MTNLEDSEIKEELRKLPRNSVWNVLGLDVQISFELCESLVALSDVPGVHGYPVKPLEWRNILVFGEMFIPGGASPYFGIDKTDGRILHVYLEHETPISLLNSSLNQFVASFLVLSAVFVGDAAQLHRANQELGNIDSEAYSGKSEWRLLVEYLISGVNEA